MRWPRTIGLALGGLLVWGGLRQAGLHVDLLWPLLIHSLVWPQVANAVATRNERPDAIERLNLLIDGALGAIWVPAMSFNLVPSALMMTMLAVDNLAVGGRRHFVRGLAAMMAGLLVGMALFGLHLQLTADLVTVLSCLPFMVAFPVATGQAARSLSVRLHRKTRELEASDKLHHETLDALEAGVVVYDADDRLLFCNEDFRKLYAPLSDLLVPGVRFEQLLRRSLELRLIPEAIEREDDWLRQRLSQHACPSMPINRQMADGTWRRIIERRLANGSRIAFSVDVTALKQTEDRLVTLQREEAAARQRLADAIEVLPAAFALFDAEDRLVVWNRPYANAYARTEIQRGAHFENLLRSGLARGQYPQAQGCEEAWLQMRMEQHRQPGEPMLQALPDNRWLRIHESRTREGGYAGVRVDVSDLVRREQQLNQLNEERNLYSARLEKANAQLAEMSETDPLTGLANRRRFDRRLAEEWQRSRRNGQALAILLIDVDHFKLFNDRHGHQAGDQCLQALAEVLRQCAQRPADVIARHGGEEFAILLPDTSADGAVAIAEEAMRRLADAEIRHGDSATSDLVTMSIGIAGSLHTETCGDTVTLMRKADEALYQAKAAGRARVVVSS